MNNNFGVDKVGLYLPYDLMEIKSSSSVEIQGTKALNDSSEMPLLFVTDNGQAVHGNKGILNTDKFNFTVSGSGGLLTFNPSKPYHPYELCGSSDELTQRVELVTSELENFGISGDWKSAKLTRLDFAKNVQLDTPLSNYTQSLNLVNFARSRRQAQYPDGYMTGNNSRGLIIYNKSLESSLEDKGITRGELQLKNSEATKSIAGSYTDKDLISNGLELFNKVIVKTFNIEKRVSNELSIPYGSLVQSFAKIKEEHGRNASQVFKKYMGSKALLDEIGIEVWLSYCAEVMGYDKKRIKREKKDILTAAYFLEDIGLTNKQSRSSQEIKFLTELSLKLCA
jgi:hypothetical protein